MIRFIVDMVPFIGLALPFYIGMRAAYLLYRKRPFMPWREAAMLFFALFCVGLASQTILPSGSVDIGITTDFWRINLVPFKTIGEMIGHGGMRFLINVVGNVVMFIPIGLMPPVLWRGMRRAWKAVALGAVCSFFIEFIQLFIGRSVDVDDFILNTLGAAIGYLLYLAGSRLYASHKKSGANKAMRIAGRAPGAG